MNNYETHEVYRGFEIQVGNPGEVMDPRECDEGLISTMICSHKRYRLGDPHDYNTDDYDGWEDLLKQIEKDYTVLFPRLIRMYDHSGIGISLNADSYPYNCPWDSGWIGYIFVDADKAKKVMGWKHLNVARRAKLLEYMLSEFKYYAAYVGDEMIDVYIPGMNYYTGPYCDDDPWLEEARMEIDGYILNQQQRHYEKVKNWIKNKVPLWARKPLIIEGMK